MRIIIAAAALCCCFVTSAHATQVQEVVSEKGIKAWLVEEHSLPLIAVNIAFGGGGSAYDPKGKEGRANMVAAMLSEGAGDFDSRRFNELLESLAIQIRAGADDDVMRLSMESLSEHSEKAFHYLGLMINEPRFDESAIQRTRRQTLSVLIQQEQNPGYRLERGWQKVAFGDHPYGQPQMGNSESVNALTKNDLKAYKEHSFSKDNLLIAVAGDITPAELSRLLDANFGALPEKHVADALVEDMTLPKNSEPLVLEYDIPQTMIAFGADGLKRTAPDYFSAHVMNHLLGGNGLSSLLAKEIREKRGLVYTISSHLQPMGHAGVWRGYLATRNEEAGNALALLRNTLREFVEKGPSDAELADAKRYITGSFPLSLDSNTVIAQFMITMQLYGLGRDYFDKRNGLVEAVTKMDVQKMATRLIDPDKLLIVMVGKPNLKTTP